MGFRPKTIASEELFGGENLKLESWEPKMQKVFKFPEKYQLFLHDGLESFNLNHI